MKEDAFVEIALEAASDVLKPPLFIDKGASLLYQITVNNELEITVDPKAPKRGHSAFQTDLCVFENINETTNIPRVVLEFKKGLNTHDVLIYNNKAKRHKRIYPYLRYGIVVGDYEEVPGKYYTHARSLDFCLAAKKFKENRLHEILVNLLKTEIQNSRTLEAVLFNKKKTHIFKTVIKIDDKIGKLV